MVQERTNVAAPRNIINDQQVITVKEARKLLGKELSEQLTDNQIRVMVETLTSVANDSLLSFEVPKTTKV